MLNIKKLRSFVSRRLPFLKKARKMFNVFISKYRCSVCEEIFDNYAPLPQFYIDQINQTGFPYSLDGEMTPLDTYLCPLCGASDRDRLYAFYLKHKIKLRKLTRIAHFAPEALILNLLRKSPKFEVVTIDLMMPDADLNLDITKLDEIPDNSFDAFICSHVLEHVDDDRKAVSELHRILKKGGWGILMAPVCLAIEETHEDPSITSDEDRWKYYGQNDHVRLYSKKGYLNVIGSADFEVKQLGIREFGEKTFRTLGLRKTSVLYLVIKS